MQAMAKKDRKTPLVIIGVGVVAIVGIMAGLYWQREDRNTITNVSDGSREIMLSEITIGTLQRAEDATRENPPLFQQSTYSGGALLGMRVITQPNVVKPIEIAVRLLQKSGAIIELDPSSATFAPGTSTFCCWELPKDSGDYTLQMFRPDGIISTFPLRINGNGPAGGVAPIIN